MEFLERGEIPDMLAFNAVKQAVDFVLRWFCIGLLAIMTVLVVYQVFARQVLNSPSPITEIASQYMFVWLVMLGGAFMFGAREHISITLLKDKYSPFVNMWVEIMIHAVLFAFALTITINGGVRFTITQFGTLDAALQIPMGLINMVVPICGALLMFYSVYNVCLAVQEYKTGKLTSA